MCNTYDSRTKMNVTSKKNSFFSREKTLSVFFYLDGCKKKIKGAEWKKGKNYLYMVMYLNENVLYLQKFEKKLFESEKSFESEK